MTFVRPQMNDLEFRKMSFKAGPKWYVFNHDFDQNVLCLRGWLKCYRNSSAEAQSNLVISVDGMLWVLLGIAPEIIMMTNQYHQLNPSICFNV